MRIDKISVEPVENSINPELLIEIIFFYQNGVEIPIEISGFLLSEDNKKLTNIKVNNISDIHFELKAQIPGTHEESKFVLYLTAPLNQKSLDYIETMRNKNKKNDVKLKVDIIIRTLISNTRLSNITVAEDIELEVKIPQKNKNIMPVIYNRRIDSGRGWEDTFILSGSGSSTFIKVSPNRFPQEINISSSDWIHDFCPVFQIGKFSVFEYLLPDFEEGSGKIEERLNESINAIQKMEENLIKAEWNQVIEDSRAVWELLRKESEIKDLLKRDGYNEDALKDLFGYTDNSGIKHHGCLNNLFNFASKFHHKLDKQQKKVQPDIKASKEDAYLIYATSMNVVNLISKKMQRLNK